MVDDKALDADLTAGEPRFMIYQESEHIRARSRFDQGTAEGGAFAPLAVSGASRMADSSLSRYGPSLCGG